MSALLFNVQASEKLLAGLRHRLVQIESAAGSRVSLVGHSRGGLLAKVLSQRRAHSVEQVITLGAPLADTTDLALVTRHAVDVVKTANEIAFGRRLSAEGRFAHDLRLPPAVPTTSIYTRSHHVLNFPSSFRPHIPPLSVWGSHNGLLVNPEVYRLLGRLLARPRRPAEVPA